MKSYWILIVLALGMSSCDPSSMQQVLDTMLDEPLSELDISKGLKQALNLGINVGVRELSKEGGYFDSQYKILLPEEAQKVVSAVSSIPGFQNVETEIIKKINASAEDAATRAIPIFSSAITSMTFDDATNILMGNKDAATRYLHDKTYQPLFNEFEPEVVKSLNKFGVLDMWTDVVSTYNQIPLVKDVNPHLEDHITNKALDGLFDMVKKKELGIRTDINQRSSDLLKRVFAKQD